MEEKVKCPNCGQDTPTGKKFCGHCGARLTIQAPQKIFCPACGAQNQPDQQFCSNCGARLVGPSAAPPSPGTEARPAVKQEQVAVKPTWGLAWGLWWRMMLFSLLIGAVIYLIVMLVTIGVYGWSWQLPLSP